MNKYIVDNQVYNVEPEYEELFSQEYPNAQKLEEKEEKIDTESKARDLIAESVPMKYGIKPLVYINNSINAMKNLIEDPEEQKETLDVISNIPSEVYRRTYN